VLSSFGFKFNLRRYITAEVQAVRARQGLTFVHFSA
jgi:hypothetical protein